MDQAKASGGAVPKAASHSSAVSRANSSFLARSLALQAAELSSAGRFRSAATLLTRAIELEPDEARYFTNRAICHLALEMHHEADQDAGAAMSLQPTTTAKPHFLRGRAKLGLKNYTEAVACFEQVLRMNPSSEEARAELRGARLLEICNAGATLEQAETLLNNSGGDTRAALDALSRSRIADAKPQTASDTCSSAGPRYLVVRNITHEVTREMLMRIFFKYGMVVNIDMHYEAMLAVVEFRKPVAADNARTGMQGEMLCGKRLHVELLNTPSMYEEDTARPTAAMTGQGNRAGAAAGPAGATAPRGPVGRR